MTIQHYQPTARLSDATVANGFVFLAGQVPENEDADVTAQPANVLAQIDAILAACGSDKAHICEAVIYLPNLADYAGQIAEKLVLSVKTVETYRSRIMEKLGLSSRVDLVQYALARGLLAEYQ